MKRLSQENQCREVTKRMRLAGAKQQSGKQIRGRKKHRESGQRKVGQTEAATQTRSTTSQEIRTSRNECSSYDGRQATVCQKQPWCSVSLAPSRFDCITLRRELPRTYTHTRTHTHTLTFLTFAARGLSVRSQPLLQLIPTSETNTVGQIPPGRCKGGRASRFPSYRPQAAF